MAYLHHLNIDSVNSGYKIGTLKMVIKDIGFFKGKKSSFKIMLAK